ncbi:NADH:ubiquinone reductase (Na(+)-transporting) subunit D [Lentisalinibacter orientalis]|jgi:Na+-transporting NADH:ubiquinone oxidoreductase subunit D|uniref:NADH:ubiquinone reductase (Na(+)-transporting) subunit D n=1 Tax=Lentisalinibacter orientalis TaxID=2992241 RepID=UPI00386CE5E6
MSDGRTLVDPIVDNNPITMQILGICSALAVTRTLFPALVMSAAVIAVLAFSNVAVSLLRRQMPHAVRIIIEVTIIASGVIVVDEFLRAYLPDVSRILSVFVGLIITNCIILGRTETFAMGHGPWQSLLDGVGNGLGYSVVLIAVASVRELLGAGTLLGYPLITVSEDGGWYLPNELMLLPPSAFFIIAAIVWWIRVVRPMQREHTVMSAPPSKFQEGD